MEKEKISLLQHFIHWRENNIKEKQFILILSFLVGIFTAIAALILKFLIHSIQNFLTDNFSATGVNYLYLVYPVVGIFLAGWFVRNIVKDDISHGVTKILYAISRRQGRIKRHNVWSSTIASAITIGADQSRILEYLRESPSAPVSEDRIALALHLSRRRVDDLLADLAALGLISFEFDGKMFGIRI